MRTAVLGAGLTGLTAAYNLSQKGHQVTVFEKEAQAGGLASSFKNQGWQWPLERFYHHFFANDQAAISLIKELGLGRKLFFKKPVTAIYYKKSKIKNQKSKLQSKIQNSQSFNNLAIEQLNNETIYPLDSPLALLTFPHLSLPEKLRTGATLAYLKTLSNYKSLEQVTAKKWLNQKMGPKAFAILWQPLLEAKFSNQWHQVPMAWFWARIKKRTRSLGYLEGGFQTLIDRLIEKIKDNGGQVILNQEIQQIEKVNTNYKILNTKYAVVISTLPTPVFLKIAPKIPPKFRQTISKIDHLWAQTLVLELDKPFLNKTYWLNINDNSFPFLAAVEHTNFIENSHYGGHHLLYIGNYLPDGHPYLVKSAEELLEIFTPYLQKINPRFSHQPSAISHQLFSVPFAQPLFPPNYSNFLDELITHHYELITNLYLANQDLVYPWDRGTNYAIELGKRIAKIVVSS